MRFVLLVCVLMIGTAHSVKVPVSSYNVVHHHQQPKTSLYNPFKPVPTSALLRSRPIASSSVFSPYTFGNLGRQPLPVAGEQICPAQAPPCQRSKYRSLDGSCNNLQNPLWGVANNRYSRLLTAKYADGVAAPTVSVTGEELPNARLISLIVFGEQDIPDPEFTLANMQWGQIITHDMSMQAGGTQSSNNFILKI